MSLRYCAVHSNSCVVFNGCSLRDTCPGCEYPIEVTNNAQDYTAFATQFRYYGMSSCIFACDVLTCCLSVASPSVTSIWPTTGPQHGATAVTVRGTNFIRDYSLLYCMFGTAGRSAGTLVSASLIRCLSPESVTAATVTLSVSNNNLDFTADAIDFTYQRTLSRQ